LIHNHYPAIAELIREKNGASSRAQRDAKHQELSAERKKTSALRKELKATVMRVAKLASINETLTVENEALKARLSAKNVVQLPRE
jgi:regulator of replication initiation timing